MSGTDLVSKWFKKAADDLAAAKRLFEDAHPKLIEIACYHCHLSGEKALKGFLQFHDVQPPMTRNLAMLRQLCAGIDASFQSLQETPVPN
jgi:HEPN domain-containing protein